MGLSGASTTLRQSLVVCGVLVKVYLWNRKGSTTLSYLDRSTRSAAHVAKSLTIYQLSSFRSQSKGRNGFMVRRLVVVKKDSSMRILREKNKVARGGLKFSPLLHTNIQ